MKREKFTKISNEILKAIENIPNNNDIDYMIIKCIILRILKDLLKSEETMNNNLRELDKRKSLKKEV